MGISKWSPLRRSACASMRSTPKGGLAEARTTLGDEPHARCVGRSRGGPTTKIHALADANGLPIRLEPTEGQAQDGRSTDDMVEAMGQGQILLDDRGYDSDRMRVSLAGRGRTGQREAHSQPEEHAGLQTRPLPIPQLRQALLQQDQAFRAVATRSEKHDVNYLAAVMLAAAGTWMRFMSR